MTPVDDTMIEEPEHLSRLRFQIVTADPQYAKAGAYTRPLFS